ncbi:NB-ARC domain disease resistance protein [Trifolium medium]|uniref:NB-ARC domain disease resistance protein n=1 Tax=Trifolium medium TaxID=97028 RepID=A0A392M0N2_9FABA|nr:NB-ARC domain disease resistance protein [Trifolium medium]
MYMDLVGIFELLQEEPQGQDTCNENPSAETTKDFATEIEVEAASGHGLTSSQGIEIRVEEGTTSTNAKTISSSTHLELAGSSSSPLVTSECKTTSQVHITNASVLIAGVDK